MARTVQIDQGQFPFDVPLPAAPLPGTHDYRIEVSGLVSAVLQEAGRDRYAIAADMSRLMGSGVTKNMLDAYSSEARDEQNLPLYRVPALEAACGTHAITAWLARVRGARLSIGREALEQQLGRMQAQHDHITAEIKRVRRKLGDMT